MAEVSEQKIERIAVFISDRIDQLSKRIKEGAMMTSARSNSYTNTESIIKLLRFELNGNEEINEFTKD